MAGGYAFIAADYSLLPPATAFEILEDIKSLFSYLGIHINEELKSRGCYDVIDVEKIIVAGSSAGGLCAYLASVHGSPKPKAILSLYGMGGDFFVRVWSIYFSITIVVLTTDADTPILDSQTETIL